MDALTEHDEPDEPDEPARRARGADRGQEPAHDDARRVRAEVRWPAVVGVLVGVGLYATLPSEFPLALRVTVVAVCLALLVPTTVFNPVRLSQETRWSRGLSLALVLVLVVANQIALGILVVLLVSGGHQSGPGALLAALQVWGTNVVAFGLLFWEMDRGGPVRRRIDRRRDLPPADFRFPQDEDDDTVVEVAARSSSRSDWVPGYVDYAYLSLTNSTAYSPTDVMPLSPRAKLLMGVESLASFLIVALVIARAVSLLG